MRHYGDRRIDLSVPFLQEGTALFIGCDVDESPDLFSGDNYRLLFLSDLASSLTPDLRQYLFPGADMTLSVEAMCQRIRNLAGLDEQTGLLYRKDGVLYFHPLQESTTCVPEIAPITEEQERKREERSRKCCERRKKDEPSFFDMLFEESSDYSGTATASEQDIRFSIVKEEEESEETLDPRVQAILKAWDKIAREFNITVEDLEVFLGYKVKLSRLCITTSGKIFLTDFDNQEVKMDDLTKALYFFFLRHPKGARLKELYEHEDEIIKIYSGITGRDDPEKIRESVRNLLSPYGNALNVSMSRIKKAFKDVMSDRIARFYYVYGRSGEIRNIGLDRDLVIWEH